MPLDVKKRFAGRVVRALRRDYPIADCALIHDSPEQLLFATILSAQCTDERVNLVTRELFQLCPTPFELARMPIKKIESLIQSTGFFRNKAKNLKRCAETLVNEHNGKVPRDLDELVKLAGVGRKTANVVLGTAFGMATGVVVDTHVGRISRRLGLTTETDPVKVERDLMKVLPKKEWVMYSHRVIHHGRNVCTARRANCDDCGMNKFCARNGV